MVLPDLPDEIRMAMADTPARLRTAAGDERGRRDGAQRAMFEAEIAEACGPKGKHDAKRAAVRYGHGGGSVTLGGRRMAVTRPRAHRRRARGAAEQ